MLKPIPLFPPCMGQHQHIIQWYTYHRYTYEMMIFKRHLSNVLRVYLAFLVFLLWFGTASSENFDGNSVRHFINRKINNTRLESIKNLYSIPLSKKSHRKTTYSRRLMGNIGNKLETKFVNNYNDINVNKNKYRNKQLTLKSRYNDGNVNNKDVEYSSSWAIKLHEDFHQTEEASRHLINSVIAELGLVSHGNIGHLDGHFLLVHPTFYNHTPVPDANLVKLREKITGRLKEHPHISWVRHEEVRQRKRRSLEFKDQFFPSQWHLDNLKFIGHDINITGVWENNITGKGVTVSVIDDGVEWTNPDILDNYSSKGSWDLNSNDGDPMPRVDEAGLNHHGTRCAGEIAAVANEYCAVGVAFGAKVSGIRILDGPMTDSLEAMAFNTKSDVNDVYSCSWGPDDNGRTVDGPHQLAQAALARGVLAGRHGYGSIFVVASGNGGHFHDNCNFDGYANSIFTVTIGAVDELGQMPYYAEQCAAMLAVTYSSGQGHQRNIVTTDWRLGTGTGCTDRHTGTSAAAPLAAGVIALMLEARPCLTWRDIQHLIVYTSVRVDIDPEEWQVNMAGFAHSHKHGFGLLDSWRLVTSSKIWPNVPFMTSWSSPVMKVNRPIPLLRSNNLTETLHVTNDMVENVISLEHVTVTVNIKHPVRGQLAISLISPYGTISRLGSTRKYDKSTEGFTDWTFSTVRCWGERPVGSWKLLIRDRGDHALKGSLKSWRLTFYGSSMSYEDILERKKLVQRAISGRYLHHPGPPCPPPQSRIPKQDLISPRVLKVVLLLSGFFFLVAVYFILETLCVVEEKSSVANKDLEATIEIQTPDGVDLEPFLPKTLAKDDERRLSNLIENGGSRPNSFSSFSFLDDDSLEDLKHVTETPDDDKRVEEFEERLKFALEQSLLLQMKQMNQIGCLEQDLKSIIGNEGLGIVDVFTDIPKKKKKKLKGILKKPKQYKE